MAKFADLTPEMKVKAIELVRELQGEDSDLYWSEQVTEDLETLCKEIGIGDIKVSWSGFWTQGSGASFTTPGQLHDLEKVLRHFKIWSKYRVLHNHIKEEDISTELNRISSMYSHYNTVRLDMGMFYHVNRTSKQEIKCNELQEELQELLRDMMKQYYKDLESAYEWYMSDESITESIECNDYEFGEKEFTEFGIL